VPLIHPANMVLVDSLLELDNNLASKPLRPAGQDRRLWAQRHPGQAGSAKAQKQNGSHYNSQTLHHRLSLGITPMDYTPNLGVFLILRRSFRTYFTIFDHLIQAQSPKPLV
jgi:hypothetical protein